MCIYLLNCISETDVIKINKSISLCTNQCFLHPYLEVSQLVAEFCTHNSENKQSTKKKKFVKRNDLSDFAQPCPILH